MDQIHHLANVKVAGSNPVFRSILPAGSFLRVFLGQVSSGEET